MTNEKLYDVLYDAYTALAMAERFVQGENRQLQVSASLLSLLTTMRKLQDEDSKLGS